MRKNILIILFVTLCVFVIGCKDSSLDSKVSTSDSKTTASKINLDDSAIEIKKKLYKACFFDKNDRPVKTVDESLEYIKSILPEGVEEIENVCVENDGITKLKYKIDDIVFYAFILHPHNVDSTRNVDSAYNLDFASGVTFPRVEIDTNWQSE